jgi:hypothetical protein
MRECTKEELEAVLSWGDMGAVRGSGLSMTLQDVQRKADDVDEKASHGLISKGGGVISEADGKMVTAKNPLSRYYSDHHKMWFFRCVGGMSEVQRAAGVGYLSGVEEQAVYGKQGILQFVKEVFYEKILRKKYEPKDKPGIFCTEHCSRFALACGLPWILVQPERVTPSLMLEWMLESGITAGKWEMVASYDCGKFFIK